MTLTQIYLLIKKDDRTTLETDELLEALQHLPWLVLESQEKRLTAAINFVSERNPDIAEELEHAVVESYI